MTIKDIVPKQEQKQTEEREHEREEGQEQTEEKKEEEREEEKEEQARCAKYLEKSESNERELPIMSHRTSLIKMIQSNRVSIVTGETGKEIFFVIYNFIK